LRVERKDLNMAGRFEGSIVIVTGASYGIGRATSVAFAREGATVVVSDVVDSGGEETVGLIRKSGGTARYVRCDISSANDVRALVEGTVKTYGRLDVAFNNAGIEGSQGPVGELPEAEWRRVIDVNLTGEFLCMQQELQQMEKQGGGAIVNNASILGTVGFANAGAYCAAKHGVLGLTQVAAMEYATKGIRINSVCPGFIETPMLARAGLTTNAEVRQALVGLHPMKRLGRPKEIADAVLYLSSPQASFVTGAALYVDGGYTAQ
jgi:NAD(P)-dependent dehydrogenase (short-subunit alcohol dehydrogenase family)